MKLVVDITMRLRNADGEFVLDAGFETDDARIVLFGPSGAGKSVTIQAIAGLIRPERGSIVLDGRILFDASKAINLAPRERRIGYLFQDYALFPHLSVAENIAFPLKRSLLRRNSQNTRKIDAMLDRFELATVQHSLPRQLSGGQRQRTALARVLIVKPDLLLLDEPFAALDTLLRERLRQDLADTQARFDVPMALISHDLEDVRLFADTLVPYVIGQTRPTLHCKKMRAETGDASAWMAIKNACLNSGHSEALFTPIHST